MTNTILRTVFKSSDLLIQVNDESLEFHARDAITGIMEPVLIIEVEDKEELHNLGKRILKNIEKIV